MRKSSKWLSLVLAAAMTASLLAGCSSAAAKNTAAADGTAAAGADATAASAEKISISVAGGSEDSMDINVASTAYLAGLSACRHLYEGLYKLDANGEVVLGQAKNVEVSADGLTYTFTLRDDITWSDGVAVTAKDFVYGWQYLKDTAKDYCELLSMMTGAEAKDDKTLVVTLAYPCSYLPSVLAFPSAYPVREDIVAKYGEAYATDPDKAVYNGPYELTSWAHQSEMVLTARPDYYGYDSLTAGEITWMLTTEESTTLASFKSGDIIYADTYPQEEAAALKDNGLHFTSGFNNYCIMFNVRPDGPAVLQDENVRRALALAVDRNRLVSIRDLDDEVGVTYTPSGITNAAGDDFTSTVTPWWNPDDYEANCAEAKKLLAEAGYADGANFPALTYIVNNDSRKEIAESIVNDWKEVLGIDTVTVQTTDAFFTQRTNGDYDIAYFGWYMDYIDLSNMLYTMTTASLNGAGYANPEYDAAYSAAISATDVTEQWKDYAQCESILAKDLPVVPLLHSMNSYLFDDTKYDGLVYYCGNYFFGYVHTK